MAEIILIRYGELALKGNRVRNDFEKKLAEHIKAVLPEAKVSREWGRFYVHGVDWSEAQKLSKVFGIVSYSLCERFEFKNLNDLCKNAMKFIDLPKGTSFAVRPKRVGKHDFSSQDISVRLGEMVRKKFSAKVRLGNPEHEVEIEIRENDAYVISKTSQGPGGLPFGTAGKVVCALSGGIDSPVAAWMMMKRGCEPIFVHGVMAPLGGDGVKARRVVAKLKEWSPQKLKIYLVPHGPSLQEVVKGAKSEFTCLLCKRLILKYASLVSRREKALGLVMGDSLGQVASQTLENLFAESYGVKEPVFRPLIGMDKRDLVDMARAIGTYRESIGDVQGCGALPKRVETQASLEAVLEEDAFLELEKIAAKAVEDAEVGQV